MAHTPSLAVQHLRNGPDSTSVTCRALQDNILVTVLQRQVLGVPGQEALWQCGMLEAKELSAPTYGLPKNLFLG